MGGGLSAPTIVGVDQTAVAAAAIAGGVPAALAWPWASKAEAGFVAGIKDARASHGD